jgi:hypothetical protein
MTGSTAVLVSFEESSALLHELAGVAVSVSQVERAAEALGAEIADDERSCVEPMGEVAPNHLSGDGRYWRADAQVRSGGPRRQAVRRFRKNPRGQGRHPVDRGIAR